MFPGFRNGLIVTTNAVWREFRHRSYDTKPFLCPGWNNQYQSYSGKKHAFAQVIKTRWTLLCWTVCCTYIFLFMIPLGTVVAERALIPGLITVTGMRKLLLPLDNLLFKSHKTLFLHVKSKGFNLFFLHLCYDQQPENSKKMDIIICVFC